MRPTGITLSAYFQFFRGVVVALFAGGIFLCWWHGVPPRFSRRRRQQSATIPRRPRSFCRRRTSHLRRRTDRRRHWPAATAKLGAYPCVGLFRSRNPGSSSPRHSPSSRFHSFRPVEPRRSDLSPPPRNRLLFPQQKSPRRFHPDQNRLTRRTLQVCLPTECPLLLRTAAEGSLFLLRFFLCAPMALRYLFSPPLPSTSSLDSVPLFPLFTSTCFPSPKTIT